MTADDAPLVRAPRRAGLAATVAGAARVLRDAGVPSPEHDARALAAHVLGVPRFEPALAGDPPEGFAAAYAPLVERRRRREPLQHILGSTVFRWVALAVEPGVFVPRPETETVAQVAVDEALRLHDAGRRAVVVDLCTGTGAIAVSVAHEVAGTHVVAVDVSPQAVALARRNAAAAGAAVDVRHGDVAAPDLLAELAGTVDVVVANPPYIPPDAVPVDAEVRDHDPDLALYGGGADGLDVPRAVVRAAARLLRPGGLLVMEHAEVQAEAVRDLATRDGFVDVATGQDLTGRDRWVVGRSPAPAVEDSAS